MGLGLLEQQQRNIHVCCLSTIHAKRVVGGNLIVSHQGVNKGFDYEAGTRDWTLTRLKYDLLGLYAIGYNISFP